MMCNASFLCKYKPLCHMEEYQQCHSINHCRNQWSSHDGWVQTADFCQYREHTPHGFCYHNHKPHTHRNGQIHHNIRRWAEYGLFAKIQCRKQCTTNQTDLYLFTQYTKNISGTDFAQRHTTNNHGRGL